MHNFKELKVWKDSMLLAKAVFAVTQSFPAEERFGLTAQIRRCSVSIPSNIAEGAGRSSDKDFCRFLDVALGSGYELETQVMLAMDFGYMAPTDTEALIAKIRDVQRMLHGLKNKMVTNSRK